MSISETGKTIHCCNHLSLILKSVAHLVWILFVRVTELVKVMAESHLWQGWQSHTYGRVAESHL